jgi:hypothetical protein
MKREYLIFAAILAVIFLVWISGRNFILGTAEKRLRAAFPVTRLLSGYRDKDRRPGIFFQY